MPKKANKDTSQKTKELEQKLSEAKANILRLNADLQNMRRRGDEDRSRLVFEAGRSILKPLLPTFDNFDLALQNLPEELESNEWVQGVLVLEKQLFTELKKEGLQEINETGGELDPARHEAVVMDAEGKKGTVTKILQKGYLLHGKILRPAKVAVGEK